MKLRGISLATVMFAVGLVAADLAALPYLAWPVLDVMALHLTLSLLPMLNVLAILGYRLVSHPEARRPFALGFFGFGLGATLAHAACVYLFFDLMRWTHFLPIGPIFQFCHAHRLPYYIGKAAEGYSYFRYYPILILINFCVPQLLAASLGGILLARWSKSGRRHPKSDQARFPWKPDTSEV